MYGFVSAALPVGARSFTGAALSSRVAPVPTATVSMAMSKSVPFLVKPKNLEGMPASFEFDPLLITDYVSPKWMSEAEIKHGRIAMLACVGVIVQELFTFGGDYFPRMLPIDAHDYYLTTGMSQILLFICMFEAISCYAVKQMMDGGDRLPGQFYFDPLGLGKDPVTFQKYQANEIMNGRLALIGIGGLLSQEIFTRQGAIDQLLHFKPLAI